MTETNEPSIIITSRAQEMRAVVEKFTKDSSDLLDKFNRDMANLQHSAASEIAAAMADEPELYIAEA